METMLQMLFSEDNVRTLVILVAIACGLIWQYLKIDKRFIEEGAKIDKKIDKKFDDFYLKLKGNDFAHLNKTFKEMTFILEKNGFLGAEDRQHINSQLDDT